MTTLILTLLLSLVALGALWRDPRADGTSISRLTRRFR